MARASKSASVPPDIRAKLARLEQLEADFAGQLEQAKLEALRQFAYGAGHEINNPLANIATRAQTLLADESDPERRRKLAAINAQAFRAHEMLADLMLYARPPEPELAELDAVKVCEAVVAELLDDANDRNTSLQCTHSVDAIVRADPTQLHVAVKALVRNALEALGRGGTVEVTVQASQRHVEIRVIDNGPGISPEIRPHIFDPFFSGREAGRGLGFGLCKAWRIITLHGGTIEVEGSPGKGASIIVGLPVAAPLPLGEAG
jgi:hypothetical protein